MKTTPTTGGEAVAEQLPTLLPCPFCGSLSLKVYMNAPSSDQTPWPHVACLECGCGQSSADKWNRRPPHAPAQSALDELQLRAVEAETNLEDYKRSFYGAFADAAELRREVERMTQAGVDISIAWQEANTKVNALMAEVEALRADRDRLHEALASVASICNETRAARDLQPRMTEIRGIARAAIDTARASTDEGVGK